MSIASDYRSVELSKPVKILSDPEDEITLKEPITIPALMKETAENYPDHTALIYKKEISQEWIKITYKQYRDRVEKMAKVFIKLGLKRHGVVAVLAFNSVEWFVAELAAIHAGGVICGIYQTNGPDACQHILENSKASIVIVDDDKQLEKIRAIRKKLPHLKAIVQTLPMHESNSSSIKGYYKWSDISSMSTDDVEAEYKLRSEQIIPNECCFLIYTSGTVGMPKGTMLSHDNLVYDATVLSERFRFQKAKETFVSYLPLSHIAGQMVDIFLPLTNGGTVYFADKNALKGTLVSTLCVAQPTFFLGVPRVFEKIQEKMMAVGAKSGYLKQMIGSWAKGVVLNKNLDKMNGRESFSIQAMLAEAVIGKVKTALGFQNCRSFLTGAAPMRIETKKYFLSLGIRIVDVWGLSETTGGHSVATTDADSFETVGKQLLGTKTKIINQDENGVGEICVKGRHIFMGYLHDIQKTDETFDEDGWMKTGDLGYIDDKDYIYVTGRIKELIITAGGENIPPVLIENNVKGLCPAISNAFLVGDKRKFLTMLIALKTEVNNDGAPWDEFSPETLMWLDSLGLKYTKLSEVLASGPDWQVTDAIQLVIDEANKKAISDAQKIQKFAILPNDFSIATGELGPSMKIRRNFILEKYKDVIEKMYE